MAELKTSKPDIPAAGKWVSYRSEIKVVDCTIRDGGLMNNHQFNDDLVKSVYNACVKGGIDYMEIGYKADKKLFSPDEYGKWKYCPEDYLKKVIGKKDKSLKLSAMADAEKTNYKTDIVPKKDSILDMIRVATYIYQIPTALDMIKDAHDKGYETCINIIILSFQRSW